MKDTEATLDRSELEGASPGGRSPTAMALRRLFRSHTAVAGLAITGVLVVTGLLAPWIAPHEYWRISREAVMQAPAEGGLAALARAGERDGGELDGGLSEAWREVAGNHGGA